MNKPLLLLGSLLLLAGGCSAIQKPGVTFKSMNIGNVSPQGFTMVFNVEISNPNPVAVPLGDVDYQIGLGGVKVLDGKAKPEGTVPANGALPVALPINLTFDHLLSAQDALRKGGGDIPYAFDGGFSFSNGPLGGVRVPVNYSGTFSIKEILKDPMLLLKSPAARKLAEKLLGAMRP